MIVSLIRTVYFLRLKAENTAVTHAGHGLQIFNYGKRSLHRRVNITPGIIMFKVTKLTRLEDN